MKIIDIVKPERVSNPPDHSCKLISDGNLLQEGFTIKTVELRQYFEKMDEKKGQYSLITVFVETDKGSIEMEYNEGYLGSENLESTKKLLVSNLGISALILRPLIGLRAELEKTSD